MLYILKFYNRLFQSIKGFIIYNLQYLQFNFIMEILNADLKMFKEDVNLNKIRRWSQVLKMSHYGYCVEMLAFSVLLWSFAKGTETVADLLSPHLHELQCLFQTLHTFCVPSALLIQRLIIATSKSLHSSEKLWDWYTAMAGKGRKSTLKHVT